MYKKPLTEIHIRLHAPSRVRRDIGSRLGTSRLWGLGAVRLRLNQ